MHNLTFPDRPEGGSAVADAAPRSQRLRLAALAGAAGLAVVVAVGVGERLATSAELHATNLESQIPTVTVVRPKAAQAADIALPGRLEAWSEAPVYARTNGYVRRWYADIGDRVRSGQVLAEIDTPDVDQQLGAARAALATADANRSLADITARRWDRLIATHAVSQQEVDQRHGDLAAREAMEREARANVSRLETLTNFKRIIAPFDGVVTSRATDIGQLIVAGDARSEPMFSVSDTSQLRIYVNVPENYAPTLQPGLVAHFTVADRPGQVFSAELVRAADAVSARSGAMLVQLRFDNSAGLVRPGAYAQVSLPMRPASASLRIPASALLFRREGMAVAVVDRSGRAQVRPVQIAQDYGSEVSISAGLGAQDLVINSPQDDIASGDRVKPATAGGAKPDARS
jgi:RND family efflux transporter MFP subunit